MLAPLIRIRELKSAKSLSPLGQVGYETKNHKSLILVKIVGYITDIIRSNERQFTFLRVDDGSASILVKFFYKGSEEPEILRDVSLWDFVLVTGMLKHWNEEIYLQPISIAKLDFEKELYYRVLLLSQNLKD